MTKLLQNPKPHFRTQIHAYFIHKLLCLSTYTNKLHRNSQTIGKNLKLYPLYKHVRYFKYPLFTVLINLHYHITAWDKN